MTELRPYQVCVRTVIDPTDLDITFDTHGVSNHALHYDRTMKDFVDAATAREAADELAGLVDKIKVAGKVKPCNCVIGISGGVDSTSLILRTIKLGLRRLTVHFDSEPDSEFAVDNIHHIASTLGLDLMTEVEEWR